ncbi:MAG: hypothetical protein GEV07_22005 [Streptosporangiales bacterium]|nr:hypothetical protein [Streptosporangiales bacterium]
MRVYVPATLPSLLEYVRSGSVAQQQAYAVTPALREWYTEGDLEELEYAAMTAAARRSLRLLGEEPHAPRKRVVIAVDVADGAVAPVGELGKDAAAVRLAGPVAMVDVVSAHVDDDLAVSDIAAAVTALPAADTGDDDAAFAVDGAEAHELAWYAVQELPDLVGE